MKFPEIARKGLKIDHETNEYRTNQIRCYDCNKVTNHSVIGSTEIDYEEYSVEENQIYNACVKEEYQVLRCEGCYCISIRTYYINPEMVPKDGHEVLIIEKRYPEISNVEKKECEFDLSILPEKVKNIYLETLEAFSNNLIILTVIGMRSTIESVCKDKINSGSSLMVNINHMQKQGILTKSDEEMLHRLRIVGNKAVHEISGLTIIQLEIGLDIINHILKSLYYIPTKFKKFNC